MSATVANRGLEELRTAWTKAAETDRTIDIAEMQASLKATSQSGSTVDLDQLTNLMFDCIRQGMRFTPGARSEAFRAAGTTLGPTNQALTHVDISIRDWLASSKPLQPATDALLRWQVKAAIVGAEHPGQVTAYLTARLGEARAHLCKRGDEGVRVSQNIDEVMAEFHLTGAGSAKIPLHPSAFEKAGIVGDGQAAFVQARSSYYDAGVHSNIVGLLNDLIVDGRLSDADAKFMIGYFEHWHPTPGALTAFFASGGRDRNRYGIEELQLLKTALLALPEKIASAEVKESLSGWADKLARTRSGRADNVIWTDALRDDLKLPSASVSAPATKGAVEAELLPTVPSRVPEIAWIKQEATPSIDKMEALYRIAHDERMKVMALLSVDGFQHGGLRISAQEHDIRRVTSFSELQGSSGFSARSEKVGGVLMGLLGVSAASGESSGGSQMSGRSTTFEVVGKLFDFSPAISRLPQEDKPRVAKALASVVSGHLDNIERALSVLVANMVDAELKGQRSQVIADLLSWVASTRISASYQESEYMGPARGEVARTVTPINSWVLPKLLGVNS